MKVVVNSLLDIEQRNDLVAEAVPNVDSLITALQAQETSALQTLYDWYGQQVFSLAVAVTQDSASAEEVTQDVFLRVWNKVEQYEVGTNFRAWLLRITRNIAIDYLRRSKKNPTVNWDIDMLGEPSNLPDDDIRWMKNALHEIPDDQRRAIELAYLQGMTHQQISDLLGVPLGTIKTRIRDGLRKLREVMEGER